jgi:hypothetical protein
MREAAPKDIRRQVSALLTAEQALCNDPRLRPIAMSGFGVTTYGRL